MQNAGQLGFELPPVQTIIPYAASLIRVALILVIAFISSRVISRTIRRMRMKIVALMLKRTEEVTEGMEKRAATIGGLLRKTTSTLIWGVAVIMALKEVGFDVGPLLAGAGVLGLAVGFGAQNLVRDIVSGLFILIENQVRVNDIAVVNGTGGLVEEINLRTIVLRSIDGVVHVFPNGAITSLSNMTMGYSFYVFDIGVAYKEDTDQVIRVMKEIAEKMRNEAEFAPYVLEPLEVFGVDKFADSAVVIKARIKTKPIRQWLVGRELNRRFKKRFDELGIEIPFPHMSLYFGEASKSIQVQSADAPNREDMKSMIREVLAESRV